MRSPWRVEKVAVEHKNSLQPADLCVHAFDHPGRLTRHHGIHMRALIADEITQSKIGFRGGRETPELLLAIASLEFRFELLRAAHQSNLTFRYLCKVSSTKPDHFASNAIGPDEIGDALAVCVIQCRVSAHVQKIGKIDRVVPIVPQVIATCVEPDRRLQMLKSLSFLE